MQPVRVVTFNVCGIKNLFEFKPWNETRNLGSTFDALKADIVCFQETKLQSQDLRKEWAVIPGFNSFFTFSSARKGYSGVAVYTRDNIHVVAAEEGLTGWVPDLSSSNQPYRKSGLVGGYPEVSEGLGRKIDNEGRTLVLDIGAAVLICLYCPANSTGDKTEYRTTFFQLLDERVRKLRSLGREVVVLGDINVSPKLSDSANALQESKKSSTFLKKDFEASPQRQIVNSWLDLGFQDTTRLAHPDREKLYSCWDTRFDGRSANFGSRLDLILASGGIESLGSDIMPDIYGSDHCPVYADLRLELTKESLAVPLLSRKRTASFTGIHSFWSKKEPKPGKSPNTTLRDSKQTREPIASKVTKVNPMTAASFFKIPKAGPALKAAAEASLKSDMPQTEPPPPTADRLVPAWKDIFAVKAPMCHHGEEPKLIKSTKKGPNKGRSFWSCRRPQGEEGDKAFRCNFFKWA